MITHIIIYCHGVDLPLKPINEIYDFFDSNKKEFVHFQNKELPENKIPWVKYYYLFPRRIKKNRFLNFVFTKGNQLLIKLQKLLGVNRIKEDEKFATGANWFSITNNLVEYVLENKEKVFKRYKGTRSCDEIFLQSLIIQSNFKNNLYYDKFDDNYKGCMRMIDWKRGNPYIYKMQDKEILENTENLFARKFDYTHFEIVKEIYEMLNKKNKEWRENGKT